MENVLIPSEVFANPPPPPKETDQQIQNADL